jgi:hypothetical protein
MPATGPEHTRRALLFAALAAARLRADSADEVWELLSSVASDLSAGHLGEFLGAFDPAMPGLEDLRNSVTALLGQADVQSSIELVSNEGDGRSRKLEVDWLLRITGHTDVSGSISRQEPVKCGFEKQGKRWRIVSIEPLAFFAPPRVK